MRNHRTLLALALATAFCVAPFAASAQATVTPPETTKATSPLTEADVRAAMTAEGYTKINDVHFKEGVWTADAKSADGKHVEVKVDASGKIIPDEHVSKVTKDQIIIKVQDAGYTNVHDVEFEGGVWKVEANDSAGADVELKLDPDDGHIMGSERDEVGGKKH